MVVVVGGWFNFIVVGLLHVVNGGMHDCIKPFTHHVMYIPTGIPISLVAVISSEYDEEGCGSDEYSYSVGVFD